MSTPIYIIARDRLTWLRQLAAQCGKLPDATVIIVDNASTYPPLRDWLQHCPYDVIHLPTNLGHQCVWQHGLLETPANHRNRWGTANYVVTDHDLSLADTPLDLLDVLREGFRVWSSAIKVGTSLRVSDVHPRWSTRVRCMEAEFWIYRFGKYYRATMDTTFGMYTIDTPPEIAMQVAHAALRTAPPYEALHLPWYLDPNCLSAEDSYYWEHCNASANWVPASCDNMQRDARYVV